MKFISFYFGMATLDQDPFRALPFLEHHPIVGSLEHLRMSRSTSPLAKIPRLP